MDNYSVQINEKQLILLILKYLNSRNYLKSYITLETETKTSLESLGEELSMLRQLILEGQFEESEVYLSPFLEKYGSSIHPAIFEIKKQYYLELLEIGPDYQIMTKLLKQLQSYSTKEQYKGLFYLLSLESITEHSEYKHWTAERGRLDCFEKVKEIINEVYPLESNKQVDVANSLQNALERLLYLEIANDRTKKDKLKGIIVLQQQQQQRGMYAGNEGNWLDSENGISILDESLIGGVSAKRVKIDFKSTDSNKQTTENNTIIPAEDTRSCKFKPPLKTSPGNNITQPPAAVSAYVTKQSKNATHSAATATATGTFANPSTFPSQLSQSQHQASQLLQSDILEDSQHGISEMDNLEQNESVIEESQETELLELYQHRLNNHYNQLQNKSVLKAQRLLASNNNPSFIPFAAQSEINQNQHYYDSNYYSQSTPGLFVQGTHGKSIVNNNSNNNVSTQSRQSQQHNSNSRVSQVNNNNSNSKDGQDNNLNNHSSNSNSNISGIKHGHHSQSINGNRSSNNNNIKKDASEINEEYVHSRRFYAQTPAKDTSVAAGGIGRSVNNNKSSSSNIESKDKNSSGYNNTRSNNKNNSGMHQQGKEVEYDDHDEQVEGREQEQDYDEDQQHEDEGDGDHDVNGSADTVLQLDKEEEGHHDDEEEDDDQDGDHHEQQQQSVDDKSYHQHDNESRTSQKQLDKAPHDDFQQFSYHKEFFNQTTANHLPSGQKTSSNNNSSSSYSKMSKSAQYQQKQLSQQLSGSQQQQQQEVFEIDYSELVEVCQIKDIQPIRTAQFSPDGEYFAVGTNSKALKTFALKDVIRGFRNNNSANTTTTPLWERLNHHGGSIYTLDWSRDGALIATGSIDQTIKIIKVPSPSQDHSADVLTSSQLCTTLNGHKGIVRSIKFNPDSRTIYSAGMPELNIMSWDCTKASIVNTLQGHTDSINSIDIDGEGNSLVSVAKDKTLRIWDLKNGIASGCIDLSASKYDQLNYVNLNNGFSNRNLKQLLQKSRKQLKSASNENTACVAHTNGLVSVWDLRKTSSSLQEIKMHSADCRSAEFDPTGNYIISTSFDKTICIYDINEKRILSKLTNHTDRVVLAKFHPFLPFILSTSADFTSRIFAPRDSIQTYQC